MSRTAWERNCLHCRVDRRMRDAKNVEEHDRAYGERACPPAWDQQEKTREAPRLTPARVLRDMPKNWTCEKREKL